MVKVKCLRTVFKAVGNPEQTNYVKKEFIYDSETIPTSKELLKYANFVDDRQGFLYIVSRETYELELSMCFKMFYQFAHIDSIKTIDKHH